MEIGGIVLYHGRRYILRGFDPASVSHRRAYLEDASGKELAVPLDEVDPVPSENLGQIQRLNHFLVTNRSGQGLSP